MKDFLGNVLVRGDVFAYCLPSGTLPISLELGIYLGDDRWETESQDQMIWDRDLFLTNVVVVDRMNVSKKLRKRAREI